MPEEKVLEVSIHHDDGNTVYNYMKKICDCKQCYLPWPCKHAYKYAREVGIEENKYIKISYKMNYY